MAESILRALRDGSLEGEHATALMIKDSIASPLGSDVFSHFLSHLCSNILAGKSQSRGLVLVVFSRSPSFYLDLLKRRGLDVASSHKWIRILDCYTDPLGWKENLSHEASDSATCCKNVKDLDKLLSMIVELGQGFVGQGKVRFSTAIDSVSEMLRHASTSSISVLLCNLRSHDQVSSLLWLLHLDLHEEKVSAALEYISSVVACVEPLDQYTNGQMNTVPFLELNSAKGKLNVRSKRRNGRVRASSEELLVEESGVKFTSILSDDVIINQGLVPKVLFNLQLSEKELIDRASVVLPFEHQGTGKPIEIYDGRKSADSENETKPGSFKKLETDESNKGEIIYFRDSDDELLDSDEDPDDDLDI